MPGLQTTHLPIRKEKKSCLTFLRERKPHGLQCILHLHDLPPSCDLSSSFPYLPNKTIPQLQMNPLLPGILTTLSSLQPTCQSLSTLHNAVQTPQQGGLPGASRLSVSVPHSLTSHLGLGGLIRWVLWAASLDLPTRDKSITPGFQSLHNRKDQPQHFQVHLECNWSSAKWSETQGCEVSSCLRCRLTQGTVVENPDSC